MITETKFLEIRDEATCYVAVAIRVDPSEADFFKEQQRKRWILRRAGFGDPAVLFGGLNDGTLYYDPYDQRTPRMQHVHRYVQEHWDEIKDGGMVDVGGLFGRGPYETDGPPLFDSHITRATP